MSEQVVLVFDVNFFSRLREIDPECSLHQLIAECFGALGYGDEQQIKAMDYCSCVSDELRWHDVSDEEALIFYNTYTGKINLSKLYQDLTDFKLLIFAKRAPRGCLISADYRLLCLCEDQGVQHHCFKAAIGYANNQLENGIFEDPNYKTDVMFLGIAEPSALFVRDPFFRYGIDKRCHGCDPEERCRYR